MIMFDEYHIHIVTTPDLGKNEIWSLDFHVNLIQSLGFQF
jgi:hypothetical protein